MVDCRACPRYVVHGGLHPEPVNVGHGVPPQRQHHRHARPHTPLLHGYTIFTFFRTPSFVHFRRHYFLFIEISSVRRCVLSYTHRKLLRVLFKLTSVMWNDGAQASLCLGLGSGCSTRRSSTPHMHALTGSHARAPMMRTCSPHRPIVAAVTTMPTCYAIATGQCV